MTKKKSNYILIFEDSSVYTTEELSEENIDSYNDGTIQTIIRTSDLKSYRYGNRWEIITDWIET